MTPKLIAVAGPLRGMIFELTSPEMIIGRDPSNLISVADRSLSRKHCLIKRESDQIVVIDLESRNGTFVNDLPVNKYVLKHGDRIRTGGSHFLLLLNETEPQSTSNVVEFESDDILTNSIAKFRLEDALFSMAHNPCKKRCSIHCLRSYPPSEASFFYPVKAWTNPRPFTRLILPMDTRAPLR
jgi:predicted component of type VI protein secretion system